MSSRDQILKTLRGHRTPFDDARPKPAAPIPVTRYANEDLLARFTAELTERHGTVHTAADEQAAVGIVFDLIGTDQQVIAWERLPLSGLGEALAARHIELIIPRARHEYRLGGLLEADPIRVGITGADAGFATTGTIALVTRNDQGRLPSLMPPVHIALLRRDWLFARLEDWFVVEGRAALKTSRSIALVTGPSSTGDIEMNHVIGVHGPGDVHVIVF